MSRSTATLVVSGSVLRVIRIAVGVVVAFFLTPFVIHTLGDQMYGFWTLVGTFVGYYTLMDLGLSVAVSRHIAGALGKGDREEYSKVFSTSLQLYLFLGLVVLAITGIIAFLVPFIVQNSPDSALFREVILIMGSSVALSFPAKVFQGLLYAELRLDAVAVIDISILLLRTALIVCVLLSGYRILALAWVTLFCVLPNMAAFVVLTRKQCPWLRFSPQPWLGQWTKRLFSYGAFVLIGNVSNQLRFGVDAFVITAFVSLAAVTHFRIAGLMASYFMTLMIGLMSTIQPWFSRKDGAGDYEAIRKAFFFSTKISICAACFVGFGFIMWGKPFIQRWMGSSYLDAYPCLVVLALGYTLALAQYPSISLMFGMAKHKGLALINTIEGIANLALSLWLVRSMGIFGVALGTFIPMVLVKLVVQPLYFCHVTPIRYSQYMRELGRSGLVVGGALVIPCIISARFVRADYLSLAAVTAVSLACYAFVVGILGFNKQERDTLWHTLFPSRRVPGFATVVSEGDAR